MLTLLGWCAAAILLWLARHAPEPGALGFIKQAIALAMLLSAALVCAATRAKHPGWIGLLGVAGLVWAAQS